jgi:long-chain acyl-CoA synthetase
MFIDFLLETIKNNLEKPAFIIEDKIFLYKDFLNNIKIAEDFLKQKQIPQNSVVALNGNFNVVTSAFLFALINHKCIIVPTTKEVAHKIKTYINIAQIDYIINLEHNNIVLEKYTQSNYNIIYSYLKNNNLPGLVLFSSGSTGEPKAIVHNFNKILEKYKNPKPPKKMINFLLFDHIGGINTLLYNLSTGGVNIIIANRLPNTVLQTIEKYQVEVLPTSPTFLNMLILAESYKDFNLSSLKIISYGTEIMPAITLKKLNDIFPNAKLIQTYGLSEIGIVQTKSKNSTSLWFKIEDDSVKTRVVDNMLEIKSNSSMLGYLNAPNPFSEDGYLKTMDLVEVDGEYIKILGRNSEIINVGGQKVYPADVENILVQMPNIVDVVVKSEPNAILGNIVIAKFNISSNETTDELKKRMREFVKGKLESYQIPQKIFIETEKFHNERLKKIRK